MKDWTVMVYMAGDNNLSENMVASLNDLGSFATSLGIPQQDKVNLLAYFDSSSLTAPVHYIDYSDGTAFRHPIKDSDIVHGRRRGENDGENSAAAYSIMNFVHWCIETRERKASNYIIVFSGHSFGFHGTSFLRDESGGGFITLYKFHWALQQIINKYLDGNKIAILGFDSCVMSMLEIGYELRDVAQTVVASEGSLPNRGWGYAQMLTSFISSFDEKAEKENWMKDIGLVQWRQTEDYIKVAAEKFVEAFISHEKNLSLGGFSTDISAWDLDRVEDLVHAVNNLGAKFNEHLYLVNKIQNNQLTEQHISIFQELKKIILLSHFNAQTYMKEQCVDITDFCKQLIIECKFMERGEHSAVFREIKEICARIIEAVDACVLRCGFSGDEYQFSNGISLYFPWTYITFSLTNYRYRYMYFNCGENRHPNMDFENLQGFGKDWYYFLLNFLSRVTLRLARKQKDENGNEQILILEDFSSDNPIWSKDNPIYSKDNPIWSRDNPRASRDNPPASRDNPRASRDNPRASRDNPRASRGEVGEYIFHFSRFKNFQMCYDISGFSDEFPFDENFDTDGNEKAEAHKQ